MDYNWAASFGEAGGFLLTAEQNVQIGSWRRLRPYIGTDYLSPAPSSDNSSFINKCLSDILNYGF